MYTFLKIAGTALIVIAAVIVALLGLAASKGFFTPRGLVLDLPAQGRVMPLSAVTVVAVVLSILVLGIVLLVVTGEVNTG
jgi:hypothetical protein